MLCVVCRVNFPTWSWSQDDLTAAMTIELHGAADLYTLDRLKELCEARVQAELRIENSAELFKIADEVHATKIRSICLQHIVRHFNAVSKTDNFFDLSKEQILEIIENR